MPERVSPSVSIRPSEMPQWKRSISSIARLSDQTLFGHTLATETALQQSFLLTALFIFYTKSAATLVFEFV